MTSPAARTPGAGDTTARSASSEFRSDVVRGLSRSPRMVPSKYFYDERGAELFERICRLDAYYPTRTETAILERHLKEIAALIGPGARIVEFGSGSAEKTELLLASLESPAAYVPIDISREQLLTVAERLAAVFPELEVLPVAGDYTRPLHVPSGARRHARTVVFFPGSTIGNFEPDQAIGFLGRMRQMVGANGAVLIGVDRRKDRAVLERAYNDPEGVTAEFNLNLLVRMNRELHANFDPACFEHRAIYDERAGRIEMHLVTRCDQIVQIPGPPGHSSTFPLRTGEHIVTEHSYKYSVEGFGDLAAAAGLQTQQVWSDDHGYFSVYLLHA